MKYQCEVIKGKGRGKSVVGFPTFNLAIPDNFDEKEGIYSCRVWIHDREYAGALHYGVTPTFDQEEITLEIFVLEYESDEPVKQLTFELGSYLRPIATFLNPKDLRAQIALDVARVRRNSK